MNKKGQKGKDGRKNTERSDYVPEFCEHTAQRFLPGFDELCSAFDTERSELEKKLQAVGYTYDREKEPVPLGHGQALRWQSC